MDVPIYNFLDGFFGRIIFESLGIFSLIPASSVFSFLGISIIADIFMCAIEKITSKTRKIYIASADGGKPDVIEVPVWNGTVANLTLMALGEWECITACEKVQAISAPNT